MGVGSMDGSVGYLFAIIFAIVGLNFYLLVIRTRRGNRQRKKPNRVAVDEAKQAIWRDKEIERRLEREQDGALERVKLREETLALYDEVRRRHVDKDRLESLGFSAHGSGSFSPFAKTEEQGSTGLDELGLESYGLDSARLDNLELDSYLAGSEFDSFFESSEPFSAEVAGVAEETGYAPEVNKALETPEAEAADDRVELLDFNSFNVDDNDIDPFDIFKRKK